MKVRIDGDRCQGHGRCYDLAPELFTEDEEGFGQVIGDGTVPAQSEHHANLAKANCPESAVLVEGS